MVASAVTGAMVGLGAPTARGSQRPRRVVASAQAVGAAPSKTEGWSPSSWREKKALQMPTYPDESKVKLVEAELSRQPPLVFAGECRELMSTLGDVAMGQAFFLQGGDCAESFDEFSTDHVRDTFRVMLQMALILTYGSAKPVVKVGRMAGQFAKPRSDDFETIDGVSLPSYRGDNINGDAFTSDARVPDPERMLRAYHQCSSTSNILRAFATGGYAAMSRVHQWNLDFVENSEMGSQFKNLANSVDESMQFMKACGVDVDSGPFQGTDFYTSHEGLLLPYEQALTRLDSTTGLWYDCSAHYIWLGERTRQLDGAHIEFLRGINNPLGVKISQKADADEVLRLIDALNPNNIPGRLTMVCRMGAENMYKVMPGVLQAVKREGRHVVWQSDPMHGNTIKAAGYKTRKFDDIRGELRSFFDVHEQEGTYPGGVHLEMTGKNVTECLGGVNETVGEEDLASRYHTHCDPRLNASQSLELAFLIAERLRKQAGKQPLIVRS